MRLPFIMLALTISTTILCAYLGFKGAAVVWAAASGLWLGVVVTELRS